MNRDSWNRRYSAAAYAYGVEPNAFLVEVASALQPGRILCLAEGEGRNALYLAKLNHNVTAVDFSAAGLAKASALASDAGVSIQTVAADLAEFVIAPGSWNAIVSIFCHVPSTVRKDLHRRCVAGLAPKGVFILEAYNSGQLTRNTGGPKDPDTVMDLVTIQSELKGLDVKIGREVDRSIVEGEYHTGAGSVTQFLGIKPDPGDAS